MKYYIKCGSLELVYSCDKNAKEAALTGIWETSSNDNLDEYMYVDERGFRNYVTADNSTKVFKTTAILKEAGWGLT